MRPRRRRILTAFWRFGDEGSRAVAAVQLARALHFRDDTIRRMTPEKKAAYSQNCSRFQAAKGWLWHWAHSRRTARKRREVLPASFSGLFSLAR